ncbi:hypothetical protein P170DRAFT_483741 [Aspergillus steynii IBT 23096]|uniref:Uncharacterized protein n=1 Tax=Aspergillus steynii IBT 23096 TaxID=1392250 RepID=A0A2I2GQ04_9EURO|nr:uncharacterized protein P170DRAFT_483741 [Aspergillus steynii IBT 23096]PLB54954.1 hypothetical protein P170DRAFT_483741 [Aspergillus steynii IBT 23096]
MSISRVGYNPHPDMVTRNYGQLSSDIKNWTDRYVCEEMPSLSEEQKQKIIESLETYCIQESWDTIQSLLSPLSREHFHLGLCEAMINKWLFTHFLDRTFWFLDGKRDETDEIGDPLFSERLQYLYQRYYHASPVNAVWWKMVTLGLANLKKDSTPKCPRDNEFGDENRKRQADMAESLANQLLSDSLFQLFLSDLPDEEEETMRRDFLITIFKSGAEHLTAHEVTLGGQVKVHQLPELEKFDPSTGLMFSGLVHGRERKDTPPVIPKPHGRVILVLRPGVYRYDLPNKFVPYDRHVSLVELPTDADSYLLCKAEVVVEAAQASPSDANQADPNDQDVWFARDCY